MPYKDWEKQKAYLRVYMREYRKNRRKLLRKLKAMGYSTKIRSLEKAKKK